MELDVYVRSHNTKAHFHTPRECMTYLDVTSVVLFAQY